MDSLESKTAEHFIWEKKKHCRQLIVVIDNKGKTHFKGNLEKRLALKELQKIVLWEKRFRRSGFPKTLTPSLGFLAPCRDSEEWQHDKEGCCCCGQLDAEEDKEQTDLV